ncbi:MAG TPA: hypothetical protein VMV82_02400 [Candidatus Dormibacteraeota bacterium]|nr:hypothetical protein [Candidatus Dormibacteraeota bacterium]
MVLAVLASFTRPFTLAADLATGVVLAGVSALALTLALRGPAAAGGTVRRDGGSGGAGGAVDARGWRWSGPVAALVAAVGWELYCYSGQPRSHFPTFSSLLDMLDSSRPGKAVAFALWLVLGWFVARP